MNIAIKVSQNPIGETGNKLYMSWGLFLKQVPRNIQQLHMCGKNNSFGGWDKGAINATAVIRTWF